ncbi:MAG: hypothetical protein GY711_35500 [bacterium]|nr:hypothetical protein [bacterium]
MLPRRLVVLLSALLLYGVVGAQSAEPQDEWQAGAVGHVRLDGQLDPGWLALLRRAVRESNAAEHEALVVEIDTPGGEISRMRHLCYAIEEAREEGLSIFAWVNDDALSAGTWIALSCEKVYMRSSATIGAAQAIQMTPLGIKPVSEKYASSYRAWVRGWAEKHGRSPTIAEAMVDPEAEVREVRQSGVRRVISGHEWDDLVDRGTPPELIGVVNHQGELMALTASEAVRLEFVDGVAETLEDVLEKIGVDGGRVESIRRTSSEDLLGRLNELRMLLLFLGLLFAFAEIKLPGFGLPGILALVCFATLFTAQYLVGLADIPHIVLAVVGVALVATELLVLPGTIWIGLTGMACVVAGVLLAQAGPGTDFSRPLDRALALESFFHVALTGVASMVGMYAMTRFLPETPILRRLVLQPRAQGPGEALPESRGEHRETARVGSAGRAITHLRPVGKVALDANESLEYEARAQGGAIERDARVRVVEVVGGRLVVEADGQG